MIQNKALQRNRKRNLLAVVGIAIGVYSVLIISMIGSTGKAMMNDQLDKMGFNCITISSADSNLNQLSEPHMDYLQNAPSITSVAPLVVNLGQLSVRNLVGSSAIFGIDPITATIVQVVMKYGEPISQAHVDGHERVCVIDETVAQDYFQRSNVVGKTLTIQIGSVPTDFTIVGVSQNGMGPLTNIMGSFVPSFVYLPYTTQMELTKATAIDQVFLEINDGEDFDQVGVTLSRQLSLMDGYQNLYKHNNLVSQKDHFNTIFDGVTMGLAAIAGISFVVSGLNIMTIMISSVTERTKEIGIKKAIGAKKQDIALDFLSDAFWISLKGSVIGISLIYLTGLGVALSTDITPVIPVQIPLIILFLSIMIGIVFGVSPAISAANLDPVDALRTD